MKIVKTYIELCFKCKCGGIQWVDSKYLKQGYVVECFCGRKVKVKPIYVKASIKKDGNGVRNDKLTHLQSILRSQGYSSKEIEYMLKSIIMDKTDTTADLIHKALQTLET